MVYTNLIYFSVLNTIGGIETWFYNLSVLYKDLDITFVINKGSQPQIARVAKNTRILIWDGKQRYKCKNLFVNFNHNIIPFVEAEKIYCVLHGDYLDMINRRQLLRQQIPYSSRIDEYIGITELVCDSWEKLTGIRPTLCYNPVLPYVPKKVLRLCSAQRMTKEKGRDRIVMLANALDDVCKQTGNTWLWDIYTDDNKSIIHNNITYKNPRLDIKELYKAYDWFVALSDNEGYCYSVVENLQQGIPCVVTDLPVFRELGLNKSNSLKCDLNMANVYEVANAMFDEEINFNYKPPKDNWRFFFGENRSTYDYKEVSLTMKKVVALDTYQKMRIKDGVFDRILPAGYQFEVDDVRLKTLLGDNPYKKAFVKVIDEAPVETAEAEPAPKKRRSRKTKEE